MSGNTAIASPTATSRSGQTDHAAPHLDPDAVRAVYREHAGAVHGYVLRLVGDRQFAEDVVQETMVRMWQHPEVTAPIRGSLRPWLFTVARNIVIDRARARKARPAEVGDLCLTTAAWHDNLESIGLATDVAGAIQSLSALHREVLLQTYFRNRTVAETAEILRVPVGTVKSRTYYALRALRLELQERGVTS